MKADWSKPVILISFFFFFFADWFEHEKDGYFRSMGHGETFTGMSHDNEMIKNGVNMVKMIEKTYAKNLGHEAIALLLNQLISRGNACSLLSHLMEFSVMYS